jgi:hypothetical protein
MTDKVGYGAPEVGQDRGPVCCLHGCLSWVVCVSVPESVCLCVCPSEANDQVALSQLVGYVWSWLWLCRQVLVGRESVQVQVVVLITARLSGSSIQVQVVAFIAARLSGSSIQVRVVTLIAARLSGSSIQVRCRRHCKVSSDGRNLSRQTDCQRSGSSGSCRRFYIVRGDSKGR